MNLKTDGRTYTITRDSHGWSLDSTITVTSPAGVERTGRKTTYHGTCGQALAYLADIEQGKAKDIEDLRGIVSRLREDLLVLKDIPNRRVTNLSRKHASMTSPVIVVPDSEGGGGTVTLH